MSAVKYLQGWIAVVGLMALGNTIQCFVDHSFLAVRLYASAPNQVNGLMARLFGVWTLLAAILRLYCSVDIYNKSLYNMTFISFILAFVHFILEAFVYETAPKNTYPVLAPLLVSGVSILWMLWGYKHIRGGYPKVTKYEEKDFDSTLGLMKKRTRSSKTKTS